MKIKIVSNGTSYGTKVVDSDTGEHLPNVAKITWTIEAKGLARCTLELIKVPVEVEAEADMQLKLKGIE